MADSQPGPGNVQDYSGISCPTRMNIQRLSGLYQMDQLKEVSRRQKWDNLNTNNNSGNGLMREMSLNP